MREHQQQLAERRRCGSRTARRSRRCSRPAADAARSAVSTSRTALPRSRPSSRAVTSAICREVLAQQLGPRPGRSRIGRRRRRPARPRRAPAAAGTAEPAEVEAHRRRETARARDRAVEQPQVGGHLRRASAAESWRDTCSTVKPEPRRRPRGSIVQRHLGIAALRHRRRRRRRRPCSGASPRPASASALELRGVVAEDLHLDRRRAALEVAEHVLQQLHELDRQPGIRLRSLRRRSSMISSAVALPLAARLQRTRMSPRVLLRWRRGRAPSRCAASRRPPPGCPRPPPRSRVHLPVGLRERVPAGVR